MGISYPGTPPGSATDTFTVPTNTADTPLSQAGGSFGSRNHPQLHADEGAAIVALEQWSALRTHDHSGDSTSVAHGPRLTQNHTHDSPDTDLSATSLHHTLGTGSYQAAPGNHVHDYNGSTILNKPMVVCTSTTRPASPFVGLMIFESDTNFLRIWARVSGTTGWQLIPILGAPSVSLAQATPQTLTPSWCQLFWDSVIADTNGFIDAARTDGQILVREAGNYLANVAVQFDSTVVPDTAKLALFVNSQLSNIQQNTFQRGNQFVPGFSQTLAATGTVALQAGDTVHAAVSYVTTSAQGAVKTFVDQTQALASRFNLNFQSQF